MPRSRPAPLPMLLCAAALGLLPACGGGSSPDAGPAPSSVTADPAMPADPALFAALAAAAGASMPAAGAGDAAVPVSAPASAAASPSALSTTDPVATVSARILSGALPGILLDTGASPADNWAGAQGRYAGSPAWAGWVGTKKSTNDAWTAKPRERADLVGGTMQNYVDPASGLPLTWTPDSPEPPDGSTDAQTRFKQAWVAYLRDYNIRRVDDAAKIYKVSGDTRYRDWAASQLDFYAANYGLWPLRTVVGNGRMFQNSIDEATSAFTLLEAARLLAPAVTSARAESWRTGLFYPLAANLKAIPAPLTNIGLWQSAAVAAIGMRYQDASLVSWGLDGSIGVEATLAACLTADNLWIEGSFSYNSFVVSALYDLVLAATLDGYGSRMADARSAMARLMVAPLDYRFDDGMLPTPGDAAPMAAIDANAEMAVYRVMPMWWGVQKAQGYQSWDTLLDPPPALPATPVTPVPVSANFAANRMAVLRNGAWQSFVHYGQAVANHAQAEALNYEIYDGTVKVSTDPGTVSYGSPYHLDYFSKGPAHNVPLVDGLGQASWAPGNVDAFSAAGNHLSATQPTYQPGVSVNRDLMLGSTGLTETSTLSASDGKTHRLGVVFNTACTLGTLTGLGAVSGVQPPANPATAYWTGVSAYRPGGASWSVAMNCGGTNMVYTVTGSAGQTVFIGTAPATPLPATRRFVYYEVSAQRAAFTAVLAAR